MEVEAMADQDCENEETAMGKKRMPDWIVVKYDVFPVFLCERCGETCPVHLPAAVDDFLMQGKAFSESHRFCKATHNPRAAGKAGEDG
jgi:hypothetical protein